MGQRGKHWRTREASLDSVCAPPYGSITANLPQTPSCGITMDGDMLPTRVHGEVIGWT